LQKQFPRAQRSLLAAAFHRQIHPNWRHYILYAEMAANTGDLAMARFIDAYKSMRAIDRLNWWPEQICELANVTPGELAGAVCRAMWDAGAAECAMIISTENPQVLKKSIQYAKKEENFKDREMFFRMAGALPEKKGTSINIYNRAAGEPPPPEATARGKLKTFDAEVIDMSRDLETPEVYRVPSDHRPEDD
jgi:hypothetical protein